MWQVRYIANRGAFMDFDKPCLNRAAGCRHILPMQRAA